MDIKIEVDGKTVVFMMVLFTVLAVLKIMGIGGVGAWSWWLITMPLWFFPLTLGVFMLCAFTLLLCIKQV